MDGLDGKQDFFDGGAEDDGADQSACSNLA